MVEVPPKTQLWFRKKEPIKPVCSWMSTMDVHLAQTTFVSGSRMRTKERKAGPTACTAR